ncbi:hypothetical protein BDY17DRAFT_311287 [Neohortaea acidophila]|uniref:Transcription factor Iwr1 domain-containing protein n=1 Tax=Neohortaea acidophila TaxID=245834 RepID=A0A6A6PPR1_9PEZI|nr:uncharacterized protein BDY17DRAFT_311287 [Neohortaea acidophila]KAF2481614.1 hypothetical protein BDY17DRAFT_311287 [Neohortaea acidophila]
MSEPTLVRLKRKRTDDAPDILIVQQQARGNKRAATNLHYVRKADAVPVTAREEQPVEIPSAAGAPAPSREARMVNGGESTRRVFQLAGRKRRGTDGGVATVVEKKVKRGDGDVGQGTLLSRSDGGINAAIESFKRPGRNATLRSSSSHLSSPRGPESVGERRRIQELADYMHQTALEEVEREEMAKGILPNGDVARNLQSSTGVQQRVAPPRMSGERSRQLHNARVAANAELGATTEEHDVQMENDTDYVYDTYILAPKSTPHSATTPTNGSGNAIGYLVVNTEEEEALWQTFYHSPSSPTGSDKAWDGEVEGEEDENAEGFYGADYPEQEVDSEDEFDGNVYGFRGKGASDEEEWGDEKGEVEGGVWSGDEEGEVVDGWGRDLSGFRGSEVGREFVQFMAR